MSGSYIGRNPQYGFFEKQRITTANGVLTAFNLAFTTSGSAQLLVSVAGVIQEPGQAYTVLSGSPQQISFTEAPANGVDIFIIWMGKELTGPRFDSSMLTDQSLLGAQPVAADTFLVYDADASSLKKVTYSNLIPTTHGDVSGPGSSTNDALARFDSTTGKVIQNSTATLSDAGLLTATNLAGTINTAAQPNITSLGTIASLVATTADINGGTFDGIVGGTTPAAGSFTSVTATLDIDLAVDKNLQWSANEKITSLSSSSNDIALYAGGAERVRFAVGGGIGLAGANYGTSGQVMTSGGSAANPSWATVPLLATDQTWTGSQRGTVTTDNDGSFDQDGAQNYFCTPTGNITLTFTNHTSGQSGYILLNNSGGHTISLHSNTKGDANLAATLSTAGTYLVSYFDTNGIAYCTTSAVFV